MPRLYRADIGLSDSPPPRNRLGSFGHVFAGTRRFPGLMALALGLSTLAWSGEVGSNPSGQDNSASASQSQSEIEQLREEVKKLREEVARLSAVVGGAAHPPEATPVATAPQGPVTANAPSGGTAAEGTPAAPSQAPRGPTVSDVRAARYVDWQGQGINIADRVRMGGYGSMRFETNDVATGNNVPGGSAGGFTFRRLVLTADTRPAPRLRVYSEVEFERLFEIEAEKQTVRVPGSSAFKQTLEGNAGGEISIEQAWGQFNFAENHGLRAGVVLVPVGRFNLLHDDDYWDIPRRTLTDRDAPVLPIKSAWRDLGAGFAGGFNVGRTGKLDYQFYGLSGAALDFNIEQELVTTAGEPGTAELVLNGEMQLSSGFFDGSKSSSAFAWRAAYSPSLNGEFAFSGYHGKYAPSFVSFREALTTFAYDHKWRWRRFETEGEAVYTSLGNLNNVITGFGQAVFNSVNSTAPSFGEGGTTSATVEMELANLSRRRYGFWTDLKYHARPKWLKNSFLGRSFEDPQIIPVLRYERVWLNGVTDEIAVSSFGSAVNASFTQQDLEQDRLTLGLSYRPMPQFSMQAAYEHNRRLQGSRLIFPEVEQDATNGLVLGMAFAF
jgi:hypothetical protein